MKKVILKKDIIEYLNKEIIETRKKPACTMTEIRDESFMQGYREGQINALYRVLNHVWMHF